MSNVCSARQSGRYRLRSILVAITSALASLSACSVTPELVPVDPSGGRMEFNGFSILPPGGTGWQRVAAGDGATRELTNITFVKGNGEASYIAEIAVIDAREQPFTSIDELMATLRTTPRFLESPRQTNLRYEMKPDNALGSDCARFDLVATDTRSPGHPGQVLDIDSQGFYCLHPSKGFVLQAYHSRRTPRGIPHVADLEQGERLVRSVQMLPVRY